MGRNSTITDPRSIYGETKDPGTTTVYESLPPPPKKFSILSASERFEDAPKDMGVGVGGVRVTPEIIIIIILAFLVWMLLSRTNKIIRVMKKMMKGGIHTTKDGGEDLSGPFDDFL